MLDTALSKFNSQRKVKCAYLVPQGAWLSTIITGAEVYAAVDFFWQPAYQPEYSSFDISFFNLPGLSLIHISEPTRPY